MNNGTLEHKMQSCKKWLLHNLDLILFPVFREIQLMSPSYLRILTGVVWELGRKRTARIGISCIPVGERKCRTIRDFNLFFGGAEWRLYQWPGSPSLQHETLRMKQAVTMKLPSALQAETPFRIIKLLEKSAPYRVFPKIKLLLRLKTD